MNQHQIVPHGEWVEARTALLTHEKEFFRLRDELSPRAVPSRGSR